ATSCRNQEVEPLCEVHDLRLVLVEGKTTGGQPLGELSFDLLCLPLAVAARNTIVSVSDQDRGVRSSFTDMRAGGLIPNPCGLLQPMERDVHQQRADHTTLWSSLLGRRERSAFDHPGFQPARDRAPGGERSERF